jgi:chromosome segregation ATPase
VREQNQFESERAQLYDKAEEAFRRLKRLESDEQSRNAERLALVTKVSSLEHECKTAHEQRLKAQTQHDGQLASAVQKYEVQLSDITSKLDIVSEAHARTSHEMQQLLSDQRRLSEKWKEESMQLKDRYENIIAKARSEVEEHRTRINDLELEVHKMTAQRREIIDQITIEKKEKGVLHARYADAEQRVERLSRQVGILVSKESEMIEHSKKLRN